MGSPIIQMVQDPDFAKAPPAEQQKALAAHDPMFAQAGPDDIAQFVKAHQAAAQPQQQTPPHTISAAPKPWSLPWLKSKFYTAADATAESLPAAGATIGGTLGAGAGTLAEPGGGSILGGIGGAGIGGMGGEAARQLVRRSLGFEAPATSTDAASQITKQGVEQGAIQGATEGLGRFAPFLRNAANSQYERALAPTTKINKAIAKDIAPQMVQRGVHGSLESMEQQAGEQAANLRPQLDSAYAAMPANATAGSGPKIIQALDSAKSKYIVNGQSANPAATDAISGVQDIVKQYGDDISPNSLRQLKQVFDEPVAARGGYAGGDLTTAYTMKAQKAAANSIRSIVQQASPDVAALNKELSFWLDVQRVTGASGLRRTGQEGGLVRTLGLPFLTALGAGGGHLAGGGAATAEGAAAGVLTTYATIAVRSPAWRTLSAVYKDRFAEALARGDIGQSAALLARFGIAVPQAMSQQPAQASPQQ